MRPRGPAAVEKEELPAEEPAYQQEQEVTVSLEELSLQPHFGWPASPYQVMELVEYKSYALAYNEEHEQATWVAYRLSAQEKKRKHERYDRFMADANVTTGSAEPDDYANSGFDRGHLAAAADFATDKQAMKESFYMTNMSPQEPSFNRGIWSKLESKVRDWADENGSIWVVTGPVLLNQKRLKKIGANKVSVPRYYYKVILDIQEPGYNMVGFVLRNEGSSKELSDFVLPVDSIEALTGLDFFPILPDDIEEAMEGTVSLEQWQINK